MPADLPDAHRLFLVRVERRVWLLVGVVTAGTLLGHLLIDAFTHDRRVGVAWHFLAAVGPALVATLALLRFALTRSVVLARQREALRAEQEHVARLDAALLVARTAAHRVNNALAPVAGYTQLLARDPAIQADPRLARFAIAALEGAQRAGAEIARLQRIVRLEQDTTVALVPPVLDLDRSTAPGEMPGR